MDYFESNMEVFRQGYSEKIREAKENMAQTNIEVVLNKEEQKIIAINREQRIWFMNSCYNAEYAAHLYAERFKEGSQYKMFFVYGVSDGRAIRELLNICDDTNRVIIYEPDKNIFLHAMQAYDIRDILMDIKTVWVVSEILNDIDDILESEISYYRRNLTEFCILPNYDILYPEQCKRFIDSAIGIIRKTVIYKNTYLYFNKLISGNILGNIYYVLNGHNISPLKCRIEKEKIEHIPAIIVSAGPSLDKNVKTLKKAMGKAFIIVVDAALLTVARAGVIPDMGISVDGETPKRFFEDDRLNGVSYVVEPHSSAETMEVMKGKHFFFNVETTWWRDITEGLLDYPISGLRVGGSVSTDAFEFVRYLGFKTIILVGQDLAFTDGRGHSSSFHDNEEENKAFKDTRKLVEVEGLHGEKLLTDYQMSWYLQWFEKEFLKYKDELKIIDATEGGARIKGTIVEDLETAIKEECIQEIDFKKILSEIPPTYDEKMRRQIIDKLKGVEKRVDELSSKLEEGIQRYREIQKLYREEKRDIKKLEALVKDMKSWNEIDQEEPLTELLAYYNVKKEYDVQEVVWEDPDLDIDDMAEKGIYLFEGYIDAIKEFKNDWNKKVVDILE